MNRFYNVVMVLLCSSIFLVKITAQCLPGHDFKGFFNGHAYFISTESLRWAQADSVARGLGGYLATISNPEENTFVATQVATGILAWIGLSDAGMEGSFKWANGEPVIYYSWGAGEPNNAGTENWVEINRNSTGKWNDMPDGFPRRYVVEFSPGDSDNDALPDICDPCPFDPDNDLEQDGYCADQDNCPLQFNPDQLDVDGDGIGDACDTDSDNDGCPDLVDPDPFTTAADDDCDGIGNPCDACPGGDDSGPCAALTMPAFDQIPQAWYCGDQSSRIRLCHKGISICVHPQAVNAHLAHGDFLGPCQNCSGAPEGEINDDITLNLYPNPAYFEVKMVFFGRMQEPARLTMFDVLGRKVWEKTVDADLLEIPIEVDLKDFSSGGYYVQFTYQQANVSRLLAIQR